MWLYKPHGLKARLSHNHCGHWSEWLHVVTVSNWYEKAKNSQQTVSNLQFMSVGVNLEDVFGPMRRNDVMLYTLLFCDQGLTWKINNMMHCDRSSMTKTTVW